MLAPRAEREPRYGGPYLPSDVREETDHLEKYLDGDPGENGGKGNLEMEGQLGLKTVTPSFLFRLHGSKKAFAVNESGSSR